ncbi:MAG: type II toxin-antitoxin system HicA family toxin [Candidatus Edwardsbacteria bacterium]|nr:type II toxin-antitoxin system HicA family toxin [Candidatus Edwardsbacteria bacterium]MBU1576921.1 type II toxin-antitoxin system HicA family toxin [Candidatus Edwardsbacteria bacterium]MBU2463082.1 type II toxin-antitoxin system HicA family toxin [Candidatus Edwardsbacteria bacterium]MBU2594282.1 type II toxin-antitoxin system HicA family toxin [Candidatus Edwardsbacteria bacterium]
MTVFPLVSGRKLVKALRRIGYNIDHQSGSHIILRHIDPPHRRLTIPNHNEIAKGTMKSILRDAGISIEEIKKLL